VKRRIRTFFGGGVLALTLFGAARAGPLSAAVEWPPNDPAEYVTKTDFTVAWARRLCGLKSLAQLQKTAGSKGTISDRELTGDDPNVTFHWRSEPKNSDRVGYMVAIVRPDGSVGVQVLTDENVTVIVNTYGALICDKCSPPINIMGVDPPWAKQK
jgi:hypothetical protein